MNQYTVIGGQGFIGRHIIAELNRRGFQTYVPVKNYLPKDQFLGRIIYCAGTTSDFRIRPYDTVQAHVSYLNEIIKYINYESITYLSSTRLYLNCDDTSESANISFNVLNKDDIFGLSKLLGESICINSNKPFNIVRISNVCGDDFESNNFLYDIIKEIKTHKRLKLYSTLESNKDYLWIDNVVKAIIEVSLLANNEIYNVARGCNTTHKEIIEILHEYENFELYIDNSATKIEFPKINTDKINSIFKDHFFTMDDILARMLATFNEVK